MGRVAEVRLAEGFFASHQCPRRLIAAAGALARCQGREVVPHAVPAQVAGKRWKVDLNARQDVALQLSSVDLPGGAQVLRWPAACGTLLSAAAEPLSSLQAQLRW